MKSENQSNALEQARPHSSRSMEPWIKRMGQFDHNKRQHKRTSFMYCCQEYEMWSEDPIILYVKREAAIVL